MRTNTEVGEKIDELLEFHDYPGGPDGRDLRYKHAGWIGALRWVLGSEFEEP